MSKLPVLRINSWRTSGLAIIFGVLCLLAAFTPSAQTQGVGAATANAALAPLLAKLKTQQDQIASNQAKIEAQTAQLKEEIRIAKIYASRGGTGRR